MDRGFNTTKSSLDVAVVRKLPDDIRLYGKSKTIKWWLVNCRGSIIL